MKFKRLAIRIAITMMAFGSLGIAHEASASPLGGGSWGGGGLGSGLASRGFAGGSWGSARAFRTPVRDFFAYRQPVRNLLRGAALASRGLASRGLASRGLASRGLASRGLASRGFASRGFGGGGGFGSIGGGGSGGYNYYSSGSSFSSSALSGSSGIGGGGSHGGGSYVSTSSVPTSSFYAASAPSTGFSYAPPVTYPSTTFPSTVYPSTSYPSTVYPSNIYPSSPILPATSFPSTIGSGFCPDCIGSAGSIGSSVISPSAIPSAAESPIILDPTPSSTFGDDVIIGDQSVTPADQYYDSEGSSSGSQGSEYRGFELPPTPEPDSGDETTSTINSRGNSVLQVSVPAESRVYVNNRLTKTTGGSRSYVSKNLKLGKSYTFNVQAVIERDGKEISLTKEVVLRAGITSNVNFDFDQPVLTQLTIKVPENASIELCGNKTSAIGKVRNFKTRLMPGKTWKDYKVAVKIKEDGKLVEKTKSLSISAGGQYVVDFSDTTDYLVKN